MTPSYEKYDAVVCGAGIAGIAGAHALTQIGLKRVRGRRSRSLVISLQNAIAIGGLAQATTWSRS
jgi:cation diffusion facilitator CzcD-associated flavoprotein CzcO